MTLQQPEIAVLDRVAKEITASVRRLLKMVPNECRINPRILPEIIEAILVVAEGRGMIHARAVKRWASAPTDGRKLPDLIYLFAYCYTEEHGLAATAGAAPLDLPLIWT